jgi:hypothetical protein
MNRIWEDIKRDLNENKILYICGGINGVFCSLLTQLIQLLIRVQFSPIQALISTIVLIVITSPITVIITHKIEEINK